MFVPLWVGGRPQHEIRVPLRLPMDLSVPPDKAPAEIRVKIRDFVLDRWRVNHGLGVIEAEYRERG
jgi:hypothetical protein